MFSSVEIFHQKSRSEVSSVDLLITIVYGFFAFGTLFVSCEIGQRGSDLFIEIEDEIIQFEWHSFPSKIKPMLPTIIIIAQQPVEIECFGSISCNRDVFKQVKSSSGDAMTRGIR